MNKSDSQIRNDGLCLPEVGNWSEKKYGLISTYATMFSTAMKNKWDCRVYVDLFTGAGLAKIRGTSRIIKASPLLALEVRDPFDKYVFCDLDEDNINALKQRVEAGYPGVDATYIHGDANRSIEKILGAIPKGSRRYKVLSFCVVDPFSMSNLHFATIQAISHIYVDFFVLIATNMDAHRNQETYLKPENKVVEQFLGCPEWRERWDPKRKDFGTFIAERFGEQMATLGYHDEGVKDTELVIYGPKNVRLYRLAFYSRNELGGEFWKIARKSINPQLALDL